MSNLIKARTMNHRADLLGGARDVLLAGVGAVSLLGKNAGKSLADAAGVIERLPEASSILAEGIGERAQAFKAELIERVALLDARTRTALGDGLAEVEFRLLPLLRQLRIKPAQRRPAKSAKRGPKPAKAASKRTSRKPRKAA